MQASTEDGLFSMLAGPFRDENFRQLLIFMGSWNFAINLAGPFFTVYMLKRLNLSMSIVLAMAVLSQIFNVLFLRLWGRLADRFSNKAVLSASGPLFILSIAMWPFTTMPESYFMTIPLLILIHSLAGMSTAGIALSSGNIALKAAPRGAATAYLASNALVSGLAATVAPLIAGVTADWFSAQELSVTFKWTSSATMLHEIAVPALNLRGLDFLFIIAVIAGSYAIHRLIVVREQGEVEEGEVMQELSMEVRKAVKHVSNVAGMRTLTYFPYGMVNRMFRQRKNS